MLDEGGRETPFRRTPFRFAPLPLPVSEGGQALGVGRKDHRLQEVFGIVDAAEVRADNDGVRNRAIH